MLTLKKIWDKERCAYCLSTLKEHDGQVFTKQCYLEYDRKEVIGYHLCFDCFCFETHKGDMEGIGLERPFLKLRWQFFSKISAIRGD